MSKKSTSCILTLSLFDGKCCITCLQWKPFTDFAVKRKTSVGLNYMSYCRDCHYERTSEDQKRRRENPEHRAKRNSISREYQRIHWREQLAKRLAKNPRSMAESVALYRKRHPDKVKDYQKRYPKEHRAKVTLKNRNRDCLKKSVPGILLPQEWEAIKAAQNYTCLHCGRAEPEIRLSIDHIIPITKGGTNHAANIQGLCKPCNSRKGNRLV